MDLRKGVGAVCQVGGCRIGRKVLKNPDTTSQRSEVKVSMLVATGVDSHSVRMHLMSLVVQGTARYVSFFVLGIQNLIFLQVHIWSVLTGVSETVLRAHTNPVAAAVSTSSM